MKIRKNKAFLIFILDIIAFYAALVIALFLRYSLIDRGDLFLPQLRLHFIPFSIIMILWAIVFYIFDLYKTENLKRNLSVTSLYLQATVLNIIISIIFLYSLLSIFKIAPRTNLAIFSVVFLVLDYFIRLITANIFISNGSKNNLLFIGNSSRIEEVMEHLKNNPQIGYNAKIWIKENSKEEFQKLKNIAQEEKINTIVIQPNIIKDTANSQILYQLIPTGITIVNFIDFYELIFKKIPLEEVDENWFIEHIFLKNKAYQTIKHNLEFILSLILILIAFIPSLLIYIIIKITSKGPVIYTAKRTGKNGDTFYIYKFRSMIYDPNDNVTKWNSGYTDPRVTKVGKILRITHLDELPQLINILKRDISFIGPRPEGIELNQLYSKELPYYEIRQIIKPGLTGWAQVNYKPSNSIDEAYEKLKYDLYYIKNQSPVLDFLIAIKTIKYFFKG